MMVKCSKVDAELKFSICISNSRIRISSSLGTQSVLFTTEKLLWKISGRITGLTIMEILTSRGKAEQLKTTFGKPTWDFFFFVNERKLWHTGNTLSFMNLKKGISKMRMRILTGVEFVWKCLLVIVDLSCKANFYLHLISSPSAEMTWQVKMSADV